MCEGSVRADLGLSRRIFWARHCWSPSIFVVSVSGAQATLSLFLRSSANQNSRTPGSLSVAVAISLGYSANPSSSPAMRIATTDISNISCNFGDSGQRVQILCSSSLPPADNRCKKKYWMKGIYVVLKKISIQKLANHGWSCRKWLNWKNWKKKLISNWKCNLKTVFIWYYTKS